MLIRLSLRILFLLFLLLASSSCKFRSGNGLAPGHYAPDFVLKDLEGKEHSLTDYYGKPILLNFFNSWCLPCQEEIDDLVKLQTKYQDKLLVLGVAVDDTKNKLKEFVKTEQVNFPVLFDEDSTVKNMYMVKGYPESFFLNSKGQLQLIVDQESGLPEARILGPRDWSSDFYSKQITGEQIQ